MAAQCSCWQRLFILHLIAFVQSGFTLATVVIDVKPESDEITLVASRLESILAQNDGNVDVVINLHEGSHSVPEGGLVLDQRHTPAQGHYVHWVGNGLASINGATSVTGWRPYKANNSIFVAPAPLDLHGASVRHLWVDGRRASRTRTKLSDALPTNTHLTLSSNGNGYTLSAGGGGGGGQRCAADYGKDTPCCGQPSAPGTHVQPAYQCPASAPKCVDYVYDHRWGHCTGGAPPEPPVPQSLNWTNPSEVEFVYSGVAQVWSEARCAVRDIANSTIIMKQPCFWNLVHRMWQPVKGAPPVYVENVRSHLHAPGSFYHDKDENSIFYIPFPGQDMSKVQAVVSVVEALVTHNATARHHWDGVTFEFATWLRPGQDGGFVEQQSAACDLCPEGEMNGVGCGANDTYVLTPGNVVVHGSTDIIFDNCTFQHLGAYATSALGGAQRIAWRGCNFSDVSAGSHMLGSISDAALNETDPSKWDRDLLVQDCRVLNMPVEYTGATGLFAGYVSHLTVEHNLFANQTYSAMTIGWGWGRTGSGRGNNIIARNFIQRPTSARCCDGGGIYTLGPQPGSALTENYLGNEHPAIGTSSCIYHDNGSGGFTDTGNVCEGHWNDVHINGKLGAFGPCGECPSFFPHTPPDCSVRVHDNWFRAASMGVELGCDQVHVGNNTVVPPSQPLPPAAAAIKSAAGPRY